MRASSPSSSSTATAIAMTPSQNPTSSSEPPFPRSQSRFAAFLAARPAIFGSRLSTNTLPQRTAPLRTPTPNSNLPLEEQLQLERTAREQAEEKVVSMSTELEELSQSLFEEANAMVRAEREKNARLEARLQIMESQEENKRRRLTELEKAIGRITKTRNLLENKNANNVSNVIGY